MASTKTGRRKTSRRKRTGRSTAKEAPSSQRKTKGSSPTRRRASRAAPSAPMLRTSERTSFKGCRWQWSHTYLAKRKPHEEAPALRFGTLVHAALEKRYPPGIKRGPHPARTFEKLFEQELREAEKTWGFRDSDGEWADAGQLGIQMLENFVSTYGKDEEWRVIASEMTFKVPVYGLLIQEKDRKLWIPSDEEHGALLFYYVGTMDNVIQNRMDDSVFIHDWKTTKGDAEKEAMGKLLLDEQGTAYWTWGVDWLVGEGILRQKNKAKGHPNVSSLNGMLYTFLRKAKPDTRPENAEGQKLNQDGSVSRKQPGKYFHREIVYRDLQQQTKARERVLHEFSEMQAVRLGKLQAYKSPGLTFPYQQCKGCPVFDICELHETDADWEQLEQATMKDWDPYSSHEIQEEGKQR